MAFSVTIPLLAVFLLLLPTPARPTTHMHAARQIALTRLESLDPDLIFGVAFSSGEPSIFTPLSTRSQSSLKPFSSRCSVVLPGSRPGGPSTSFLSVFTVGFSHLSATFTRDHLMKGYLLPSSFLFSDFPTFPSHSSNGWLPYSTTSLVPIEPTGVAEAARLSQSRRSRGRVQ